MTKTLATIDRAIALVLGLLLVAGGLVPAATHWDIPYVSDIILRADRARIAALPHSQWFAVGLACALLLCVVFGLWILIANIRSRTFSNRTEADGDSGETVINVQRVANAACAHMASEAPDVVQHAEEHVAMVRDRPTVTFTVTTHPAVRLDDAVRYLEAADRDFSEALGAVDVDTVYKLQLDRID